MIWVRIKDKDYWSLRIAYVLNPLKMTHSKCVLDENLGGRTSGKTYWGEEIHVIDYCGCLPVQTWLQRLFSSLTFVY